jgi:hypothetical protein
MTRSLRSKILYFSIPSVFVLGIAILLATKGRPDTARMMPLGANATLVSLNPPDKLNFAGEPVPMRDFEVKERMEKELIRYIFNHSATILNIKRAHRWEGEMKKILKDNGVPEDFFYLCVAESHLTNAVSPAGAKGFWQFMPETAKNYGLEVSDQVDERYDPIKSTHAAAQYLKDAHRKFNNWTLVAASYNMGVGGLENQMNRQGVTNYYDLFLNMETSAYVFRVLAIKSVLQEPETYGFALTEGQLYQPLREKHVKVTEDITDLVQFAKDHGTTYKMVKVLNPWMLKDELKVEKDQSYLISIPVDADYNPPLGELVVDTTATDSASKQAAPTDTSH